MASSLPSFPAGSSQSGPTGSSPWRQRATGWLLLLALLSLLIVSRQVKAPGPHPGVLSLLNIR
ncbi:hypothetical protein E5K00_04310 [Hymenobacter aquaticus]|uniref:Uncharacterized protein n=1 Tax=Hymenobacter aquaticus TaxID=1867101 RepID=A0A4Z0Q3Z6_9BACT|nr:hypothetical protein [Hymenobacter aquaticus]TGE24445.1 hypothetical protein E5K00_04310 [Hymenobacter aquaticus]